jgi:V8-like Glu-specific endopeptidase
MEEQYKQIKLQRITVLDDDIISTGQSTNEGYERIVGANDFLPISFLKKGVKAANSVCQLKIRKGFYTDIGTGFMITPSLMMTNHHVIKSLEQAEAGIAYFHYEEGANGNPSKRIKRKLKPHDFYYSYEKLDLAIVAVENEAGNEFGYHALIGSPDKLKLGDRVNIIQHPDGRKKEIALHDNQVKELKMNKIHYLTDTQQGSSGAPVFNNKWELVALHHWGSPSYNVGIRISAICNHLQQTLKTDSDVWGKKQYCNELLNNIH